MMDELAQQFLAAIEVTPLLEREEALLARAPLRGAQPHPGQG